MMRLFIGTSCLIFLTLLFVWHIQVKPTSGVPNIYFIGSLIIVLSSIGLHLANKAISRNDIQKAVYLTISSIALGILFGVTQYLGWDTLITANQQYKNVLLPFSVIHFAHIVLGLVFLVVIFIRLRDYQIHSRAMLFSSNVFYFWHFLGFIWLSFLGIIA